MCLCSGVLEVAAGAALVGAVLKLRKRKTEPEPDVDGPAPECSGCLGPDPDHYEFGSRLEAIANGEMVADCDRCRPTPTRIQLWFIGFPGPVVFLNGQDVTDHTFKVELHPGGLAVVHRFATPHRPSADGMSIEKELPVIGDYEVLVMDPEVLEKARRA